MSTFAKKTVHSYYHHVDNGGFTFKLVEEFDKTDPDHKWYSVELSNSWFGYVQNTTTICSGSKVSAKILRELGEFFILAASKMEVKKD